MCIKINSYRQPQCNMSSFGQPQSNMSSYRQPQCNMKYSKQTVPGSKSPSATQGSVKLYQWSVWRQDIEVLLIKWFDAKGGVHCPAHGVVAYCLTIFIMRRLVSRISNSSSFVSWHLKSMMFGYVNDGRVDLTTPLGHEIIRSLIDIWELDSESGFVCLFQVRWAYLFFSF